VARARRLWLVALAAAAIVAIAVALWQLQAATSGLEIAEARVGPIPVTVFRPKSAGPTPVVVIAHGFAGSQQLMQPFAATLARNGYVAVTFDFPGHGRNAAPLGGGLADDDARSRELLDALGAVVAFARDLPHGDGRLALLGHSMASDIVVRHAQAHPDVQATVAVSLFSHGVGADSPRNLLVVDGALEPAVLKDEARRVVGMAAAGQVKEGVTYGSFAGGTARRLALADGVEHIGVLYSGESMAEALGWLDQAFGRAGAGYLDARGVWLGLLYLGLVALARPLSSLLPRVAPEPLGASLPWHRLLLVAIAPALLTPLLLWRVPTAFLPILLGDYLAVHFGLYGLLTAASAWVAGGLRLDGSTMPASRPRLAVAVLAVAAYGILAMGLPLDRYVTSFLPIPERVPLVLALLAGTLPYFVADEWVTRGALAPRRGYATTKLCFLLSLGLAVALNLPRLFFLIIIIPSILLFFIVYGLFSGWAYRRTYDPLVGAAANALVFAWAIAVTFPLVSR
jgi:predicted alpha/beta-hydrolase family hydrolase